MVRQVSFLQHSFSLDCRPLLWYHEKNLLGDNFLCIAKAPSPKIYTSQNMSILPQLSSKYILLP